MQEENSEIINEESEEVQKSLMPKQRISLEAATDLWRTRQFMFAYALMHEDIKEKIDTHRQRGKYVTAREKIQMKTGKMEYIEYDHDTLDPTQRVGYHPPPLSYPYSLMEGISGEICFLSDLLWDMTLVRFPGYEI